MVTSVHQLVDGLLDQAGGGGVEGRARLVHQQDPRPDRQRAGDAQPLLLAAGQGAAGLAQPVRTSFHSPALVRHSPRVSSLRALVLAGPVSLRPATTLS